MTAHNERNRRGHEQKEKIFKPRLFPPERLIQELLRFPNTTQLTDLINDGPEAIVRKSKISALKFVFPVGASPSEIEKVRQAKKLGGNIKIYEGKELIKYQMLEKKLLRKIVRKFFKNPEVIKTFTDYINTLVDVHSNVLAKEYRDFTIPRFPEKIEDFHYFKNIGISASKDDMPEGPDPLRNSVIGLLKEVLESHDGAIKNRLLGIIKVSDTALVVSDHKVAVESHSDDEKALALILGFLSNFLRGGVFYGFRKNQDMNEQRKIAFDFIKKARAEKELNK